MPRRFYYFIKVIDPKVKRKKRLNYLIMGRDQQLFTVTEPIPLNCAYSSVSSAMAQITKMQGFRSRSYRPPSFDNDFEYRVFRFSPDILDFYGPAFDYSEIY